MKLRVMLTFHDASSLKLHTPGEILEWDDKERIDSALKRGLVEVVEEKKPEEKATKKAAKKK